MPHDTLFELRVLNGLHQGAALPLVGEQWLIGADDHHDLALYDPGIAALHCRLNRTEAGWTLEAEQSLINDNEGHALTATELVAHQTFALGNVWLCLAPADDLWPQLPVVQAARVEPPPVPPAPALTPRARPFKAVGAVVVGLIVGAAASFWGFHQRGGDTTAHSPRAVTAPPTAPAEKPDARISLNGRDEIRRRLSTLLSERLLNDVSIEDSTDGLMLSGSLKEDALPVYQRMLKGFNDRYATSVPVLDKVVALSSGLPFAIAQIISGTNAHLVTADGHRLYVGDQYNGVRLTRIDDQRLEFDGDQHIEMNW